MGKNTDLAQQIDIYPTILNMIGYQKPFRSWGRSLISNQEKPFVINYNGISTRFIKDSLTLDFTDENNQKIFKFDDKPHQNNIYNPKLQKHQELSKDCKAFLQVYYKSIKDKKME